MFKAGDTIGQYKLVSRIGEGAFGVVWLAEKQGIIKTKFALKLPKAQDIDLEVVKQEAAVWLHASGHPNVMPIIEADVYNDQAVIVSEYTSDGSLQNHLDELKGEIMPIDDAGDLLLGILSGLEHLHNRRVIHQDLKPANILLQGETPRLADFGLAGVLKSDSYLRGLAGTLPYMAPEAFDGKRSVRTDLWAVGIIFYQLLSGSLPFPQREAMSLIGAIVRLEPPPLPSSVPKSLKDIVETCLQKDEKLRYQSATEMKKALRAATKLLVSTRLATIPTPPPPVPPPDKPAFTAEARTQSEVKEGLTVTSPPQSTKLAPPVPDVVTSGPHVTDTPRPDLPRTSVSIARNKYFFPMVIAAGVLIVLGAYSSQLFIRAFLICGAVSTALGFIRPDRTWRWGMWVSLPLLFLVGLLIGLSLLLKGYLSVFFLLDIPLLLSVALSAYLGAYLGAWLFKRGKTLTSIPR